MDREDALLRALYDIGQALRKGNEVAAAMLDISMKQHALSVETAKASRDMEQAIRDMADGE